MGQPTPFSEPCSNDIYICASNLAYTRSDVMLPFHVYDRLPQLGFVQFSQYHTMSQDMPTERALPHDLWSQPYNGLSYLSASM